LSGVKQKPWDPKDTATGGYGGMVGDGGVARGASGGGEEGWGTVPRLPFCQETSRPVEGSETSGRGGGSNVVGTGNYRRTTAGGGVTEIHDSIGLEPEKCRIFHMKGEGYIGMGGRERRDQEWSAPGQNKYAN